MRDLADYESWLHSAPRPKAGADCWLVIPTATGSRMELWRGSLFGVVQNTAKVQRICCTFWVFPRHARQRAAVVTSNLPRRIPAAPTFPRKRAQFASAVAPRASFSSVAILSDREDSVQGTICLDPTGLLTVRGTFSWLHAGCEQDVSDCSVRDSVPQWTSKSNSTFPVVS
jgi:hypothetical protein